MRFAKAGGTEAALAAHFEYNCALEGADRPAYVPVVASGSVTCPHCTVMCADSAGPILWLYITPTTTVCSTAMM